MERPLRCFATGAVLLLLSAVAAGCNILGPIAAITSSPPNVTAAYHGLANQRVGVMTWADRGVKYYYATMGSDVQSEISGAVTERLKLAGGPKPKVEELAGATFVDAREIYKWQRNHPEMDNSVPAEVAPRLAAALPMSRLIHVEVQEFMTRDPNTELLLRGFAVVNIRVVEIDPATRAAKQAFEDLGVQVTFPAKAPEGVPATASFTENVVRRGLIQEIGTAVAIRFFKHPEQ